MCAWKLYVQGKWNHVEWKWRDEPKKAALMSFNWTRRTYIHFGRMYIHWKYYVCVFRSIHVSSLWLACSHFVSGKLMHEEGKNSLGRMMMAMLVYQYTCQYFHLVHSLNSTHFSGKCVKWEQKWKKERQRRKRNEKRWLQYCVGSGENDGDDDDLFYSFSKKIAGFFQIRFIVKWEVVVVVSIQFEYCIVVDDCKVNGQGDEKNVKICNKKLEKTFCDHHRHPVLLHYFIYSLIIRMWKWSKNDMNAYAYFLREDKYEK